MPSPVSSERPHVDVLIAGGGFAGLPLALALAGPQGESGLSVVIAEKSAPEADSGHADTDGRAFALSASSVRMLRVLGVWEAVAEEAQPVHRMVITDSRLEALSRPPLLSFDTDLTPEEPALHILEAPKLRQALARAVAANPAIDVLAPVEVTAFSRENGGMSVQLAGEADGYRELTCQLLVAADGRASPLRRKARIPTVSWQSGQWGIVATLSHDKPHEGVATQHFLPAGPFAMLPLTDQRMSLVWTETAERARQIMAADDQTFLAEVKRRMGTALGEIALAGPRGAFPLTMVLARDYVQERFALVGDAAHGMHWIAGQGLNYGLRGVAALAEVIWEARRLGLDFGAKAQLLRYERWRRFDAVTFTAAMAALNALFSNDIAPVRLLRDWGLSLFGRLPGLTSLAVQEAAGLSGDVPRLLRGEPLSFRTPHTPATPYDPGSAPLI